MASQESGTKDLQFFRRRHTKGPNDWAGAWVTPKEAKQLRSDIKYNRAQRKGAQQAAAAANPALRTGAPAGGVPVPGGPLNTAPYPTVPVGGTAPPSWWIPQAFTGNLTEDQKFANAANAVLPSLSPEDQQSLGRYLATNFGNVFGAYSNANFTPIPTKLTNERTEYLNPARAQATLGLLERMKTASGGQDLGTGYRYLTDAVNLLNRFTTGGPMTREQYNMFTTALKNLEAQAGKDITPYRNLAQLFSQPSFSAGPLVTNAPSAGLNV